jgi:hypothetical protein
MEPAAFPGKVHFGLASYFYVLSPLRSGKAQV